MTLHSAQVRRLVRTFVLSGTAALTAAVAVAAAPAASAAPVASTAPTAAAQTMFGMGTSATFPHFRVTVGNTVRTASQGLLVHASVCVRSLPRGSTGGKTRISWAPWTVLTSTGTYHAHLYDSSHPPQSMFASDKRYAKGDCAFGFIPFSKAKGRVATIVYRNGVGDAATWSVPGKATSALGSTKHFDHLTVTATAVKHDAGPYWYGARVKVCATSLPAGASSIRVRTQAWTMSTNTGVLTQVISQEGVPDLGTEYPQTARLTVGDCASGWVAFPLTYYYSSSVHVTQVNYHDAAGRKVSFAVGS